MHFISSIQFRAKIITRQIINPTIYLINKLNPPKIIKKPIKQIPYILTNPYHQPLQPPPPKPLQIQPPP